MRIEEHPEPEYPRVCIEAVLVPYFNYFYTLRIDDDVDDKHRSLRFQPLDQTVPLTADLWNWALSMYRSHTTRFDDPEDPVRLTTPLAECTDLATFTVQQKFAMLFALNYYDASLLLDVLIRDMAFTLDHTSDRQLNQLLGDHPAPRLSHIECIVERGTANLDLAARIMTHIPRPSVVAAATQWMRCTSCPSQSTLSDPVQGRFHFCTRACYDDFFHTPIRCMQERQ